MQFRTFLISCAAFAACQASAAVFRYTYTVPVQFNGFEIQWDRNTGLFEMNTDVWSRVPNVQTVPKGYRVHGVRYRTYVRFNAALGYENTNGWVAGVPSWALALRGRYAVGVLVKAVWPNEPRRFYAQLYSKTRKRIVSQYDGTTDWAGASGGTLEWVGNAQVMDFYTNDPESCESFEDGNQPEIGLSSTLNLESTYMTTPNAGIPPESAALGTTMVTLETQVEAYKS